jgi:hypothetical protein
VSLRLAAGQAPQQCRLPPPYAPSSPSVIVDQSYQAHHLLLLPFKFRSCPVHRLAFLLPSNLRFLHPYCWKARPRSSKPPHIYSKHLRLHPHSQRPVPTTSASIQAHRLFRQTLCLVASPFESRGSPPTTFHSLAVISDEIALSGLALTIARPSQLPHLAPCAPIAEITPPDPGRSSTI